MVCVFGLAREGDRSTALAPSEWVRDALIPVDPSMELNVAGDTGPSGKQTT